MPHCTQLCPFNKAREKLKRPTPDQDHLPVKVKPRESEITWLSLYRNATWAFQTLELSTGNRKKAFWYLSVYFYMYMNFNDILFSIYEVSLLMDPPLPAVATLNIP
ncbi:hypothetical protein GOODEAATRI_034405 [Goodea atripinnis]|uniref:Uncharacterized protein n=1 Tax=Goodea atripinnis TaxID=208336 RepID=A0ABV0MXL9_9TELE